MAEVLGASTVVCYIIAMMMIDCRGMAWASSHSGLVSTSYKTHFIQYTRSCDIGPDLALVRASFIYVRLGCTKV